ncbi:MAG: hypothetical protein J0M15_06390 [Deltaproteobacteria bacterium]|nr:hypothetical protein [Deltaproteobacteria bacterium]
MKGLLKVLTSFNLAFLLALPLSNVWAAGTINWCIEFYSPVSTINIKASVALSKSARIIEIGDVTNESRVMLADESGDGFSRMLANSMGLDFKYVGPRSGQNATHKGYGDAADSRELEITKKLDEKWMEKYSVEGRMSYALLNIRTPNGLRRAHLRVIDGSGNGLSQNKGNSTPDYFVPAEHILDYRGVQTPILDEFRRQGYRIFEVGKYFIDGDLSPRDYAAAKVELWKWFYKYFLDEGILQGASKIIFVFDVFNEDRRDSTIKNFGAQVLAPELFIPRLEEPNYILISDIKTMRAKVERIIKKSK